MKSVMRQLLLWRREGKRWITGFLSDQKPSHAGRSIEVEFLSRPTPFIYGTEELARRLDAVVLMFDTEVKGRGRYKSTIRLITDNASQMPKGEITRLYADYLTRRIRQTPEAYLWSHNRWRLSRASL
jgi:KDO2-lipid IV(A) lauroyltransferase